MVSRIRGSEMRKQKTAKEYLKEPYGRVLVPEEDGSFYAKILEFPGCFSLGDTAEEAFQNLEEAAGLWVESELEDGHTIPRPFVEEEYSGKFPLRMPKDLHRKAALAAQYKGTSLNLYIVAAVGASVGMDSIESRVVDRITNAIFQFSSGQVPVASTISVAKIQNNFEYQSNPITWGEGAASDTVMQYAL